MAIVTGLYEARGVTSVYADGREMARVRGVDFAALPLRVDDAVDEEEYLGRVARAQFKPALEKALAMLSASARSETQIARALALKGFVPPCVEAVVGKLTEMKLLNDAQLAARFVELNAGKNVGAYALKRKLLQKGVSARDAERALQNIDAETQRESACRTARHLMRRYEGEERRDARRKLGQALARRGFGWDDIYAALDACYEGGEDET